MTCTKNIKKHWLFGKFNGDHNPKPIMVWKFMDDSSDFCVRYRCEFCGAEGERHFVEWDELLSYGLTNEQIAKINTNVQRFNKP